MNKLKKEYERFIKKIFKKIWQSSDQEQKDVILSDVLGMKKPYIGFHSDFLDTPPTNEDIVNLKKNLDQESIDTIDNVLSRIYTPIHKGWYLDIKDLYSDREKEGQQNNTVIIPEAQQLKYNPSYEAFLKYNMLESIYFYKNGLTLLPEDVINRIKGKDIIDGGAFVGDSAVVFLDYEPSAIHCFEPSSDNYENLLLNIKDKKCEDKIIPVKKGLSEQDGVISASGEGASFSICLDEQGSSENIECISIDSYTEANNLDVGVIKLDVEGFEFEVIKGAKKTIQKFKPVLLISLYHTPKDFFQIKPYIEELGLEYKISVRKLLNHSLTAEVMLICY